MPFPALHRLIDGLYYRRGDNRSGPYFVAEDGTATPLGTPVASDGTNAAVSGVKELSIDIGAGGTSQVVAISATSAQSAAIASSRAVITPTVDCFVRQGSNPTALSDGTDQFLVGGQMYRVSLTAGNKLAFKTATGTGSVYITPGA